MPHEMARRSMELFAGEVLPHIRTGAVGAGVEAT
jgi:hypothetical protein